MLQYPYPIRLTPIWGKTMRQFSERFSSCRTQQEYTQVGMKIFRFFRTEMCIRDSTVGVAHSMRIFALDIRPLIALCQILFNVLHSAVPVSYTHLDVYKRQPLYRPDAASFAAGRQILYPVCGQRQKVHEDHRPACLLYTSRCV